MQRRVRQSLRLWGSCLPIIFGGNGATVIACTFCHRCSRSVANPSADSSQHLPKAPNAGQSPTRLVQSDGAAHMHTWLSLHDTYVAGYFAGLERDDRWPYLAFTLHWWCWHAGNFVGHHTMCSQLEVILLIYEQD